MKFLVKDTQSERHRRIRAFVTDELALVAVLLAAVDLEWTLRRALYVMGTTPIKELREQRISSLRKYARVWRKEVRESNARKLEDVVDDWTALEKAYEMRHKIVHGSQGSTSVAYASARVDRILAASGDIVSYCEACGYDVYARITRRVGGVAGRKAGA